MEKTSNSNTSDLFNSYEVYIGFWRFGQYLGSFFASDVYREDYYISMLTKVLYIFVFIGTASCWSGVCYYFGTIEMLQPLCVGCLATTVSFDIAFFFFFIILIECNIINEYESP